jgi:hypothetical protein
MCVVRLFQICRAEAFFRVALELQQL